MVEAGLELCSSTKRGFVYVRVGRDAGRWVVR